MEAVAVYSEPDAGAPHTRLADRALAIGPGPAAESYLNIDAVIGAARESSAEAVHPGYGFLAENPEFAEAVAAAGLTWVGPPPAAMRAMADKVDARRLVSAAGVPVAPPCAPPRRLAIAAPAPSSSYTAMRGETPRTASTFWR